jgi:hypothetical protein
MNRIFLGMAVACGSLLTATYVLGLCASAETRATSHVWHDVHFLVGLLTVIMGLLVHSIVFTYFLGTGKWVREVARVYRLPDWVYAQAIRNKRRAFPFELAGMSLFGLTAWFGAGTDARGWPSLWHLALAATTFAFNLGAFVAEYAAIVGQARLLLEVKREADRLRAAQHTAAPATARTEEV